MNKMIIESKLFNVLMYVLSVLFPTYWTFSNFQEITSTDNAFLAALVVFFGFMLFLYWFLTGSFSWDWAFPREKDGVEELPETKQSIHYSPTNKAGFVYFLCGNGYTKIGKAKNIDARLNQYSPKLPFETKVVYSIYSENALRLESELHDIFRKKRGQGEWFLLDDEDFQRIKEIGENHEYKHS